MDPDRRSFETEFFAYPILQIALIGEMECRGYVREENEGRRRDARLCSVEDPDVALPRAGRRMLGGDTLDELVQIRSLHAPLPRFGDLVDRLKQSRRPFTGLR